MFLRPDPRKVARLALAAADAAGTGLDEAHSLGVSFLSSKKMADVNYDFLRHSGDTDVICFDYRADEDADFEDTAVDILICPAVAFREAQKRGLPYSREVTLYLVHGLLHAAGFDDLKPQLKRIMRRAEKRVMNALEKQFDFDSVFRIEEISR